MDYCDFDETGVSNQHDSRHCKRIFSGRISRMARRNASVRTLPCASSALGIERATQMTRSTSVSRSAPSSTWRGNGLEGSGGVASGTGGVTNGSGCRESGSNGGKRVYRAVFHACGCGALLRFVACAALFFIVALINRPASAIRCAGRRRRNKRSIGTRGGACTRSHCNVTRVIGVCVSMLFDLSFVCISRCNAKIQSISTRRKIMIEIILLVQ
jgi:hypothetical protein